MGHPLTVCAPPAWHGNGASTWGGVKGLEEVSGVGAGHAGEADPIIGLESIVGERGDEYSTQHVETAPHLPSASDSILQ